MNAAFFTTNRHKLMTGVEEGSVCVCFSGNAPRKSANEMYEYKVPMHFYYLTGLEESEMVLLLAKRGGTYEEVLFIPSYDELKAKWDGATVTKEKATAISGIENVMYVEQFDEYLNQRMATGQIQSLYMDLMKIGAKEPLTYSHQMAEKYKKVYPYAQLKNIHTTLLNNRNKKQPEEIAAMQKALAITKEGIEFLMKYAASGLYEYQLEAYFDFIAKTNGVTDYGFKTIAAAGENATILHYQKNNTCIPEDVLILFDLGIKYNHYGVDISRTFPVNGKFSERQKLFYEIVLKAQQAVIDAIKPGLPFARLNEIVREIYLEELGKLGMVANDVDVSKYYFHGVSHYLSSDAMVLNTPDTVLEEGMVLTVEPGLYIKEEKIGIRIEDDVLVTSEGAEVLSKDILKTVEEIEAFMARR
ncbi:MAG: aminopeptidase P family protein [Cellulosilyticaceae bacterium]